MRWSVCNTIKYNKSTQNMLFKNHYLASPWGFSECEQVDFWRRWLRLRLHLGRGERGVRHGLGACGGRGLWGGLPAQVSRSLH